LLAAACRLSCVFFFNIACSAIASLFGFSLFFLMTVSLTTTAYAKEATRIAERAAKPTNALAWGTATKEKSITVATINAKLF
jgi:hypothetical protein